VSCLNGSVAASPGTPVGSGTLVVATAARVVAGAIPTSGGVEVVVGTADDPASLHADDITIKSARHNKPLDATSRW